MGNTYTTTLHCINSSIIKLSKLTKVAKVYRGVSGGVLPDACRVGNAYNVKGGVEGGFVSTTTDEKTAFFYAAGGADKSKRGGPAIVFETQMGMIDRGADVAWLSEFPHEAEVSTQSSSVIQQPREWHTPDTRTTQVQCQIIASPPLLPCPDPLCATDRNGGSRIESRRRRASLSGRSHCKHEITHHRAGPG